MRARRPSPSGHWPETVSARRRRASASLGAFGAASFGISPAASPAVRLAASLGFGLLVSPALAAPQEAPLPQRKPQATAAAPLPPPRGPARKAMPLPPARPAEIEEAREAEAQEEEQQEQKTQEQPREMPAARVAARADAPPPPAARRPTGRAVPFPPARPAEIEEAREAEAQAAEQQAQQPSGLRLAARTTMPEPAPAFAPFAPPPQAAEPAPDTAAPASGPGGLPAVCAALVEEGTILADLDKSIPGKGSCGLAEPVRLSGVRLSNGSMVPLKPASITNCAVAAATAAWVREDLAPAVAALGAPVTAVRVAASYDCRSRNRIPGARMSEHGLGNALDVGGFELADGRVVLVEKGGLPPRLRAVMKESACRRFTTVLGPGSDGYHEDHIHVDLAQRRLDIRLCRWNLDAGTAVATRKNKPGSGSPASGKPEGAPAGPPSAAEPPARGASSEPAGGPPAAKP